MKKPLLIVIITLVVATLGVGGYFYMQSQEESNHSHGSGGHSGSSSFNPPEACEVLTQEVATKVLGAAEKGDIPMSTVHSDDIEVSDCIYSQPSGDTIASIRSQKQASLLVRGAKTPTGVESNESVFESSNLPAGAVTVSGYGKAAFWNPEYGQLNVLNNGNWYIVTLGVNDTKAKTIEETKQLADAIKDKL